MVALVVVVVALAVGLAVVIVVGRRRLRSQRQLAEAATGRGDALAAELADETAAKVATQERATAAAEQAAAAELRANGAEERAATAAEQTAVAEERAAVAEERAAAADERAADAHRRLAAAEAQRDEAVRASVRAAGPGVDADFLWALERARSERTWRNSVAVDPEGESAIVTADRALVAALQVELDAVREDVGALVDLDAELPDELDAATSLLTLRAAQELLAVVVRRSESAILHVRADDGDVVVTIEAFDADGLPVATPQFEAVPGVEPMEDGVRLIGAATPELE